MIERNVLQPPATLPVVSGLEHWPLSRLHEEDAYKFDRMLAGLRTMKVMHVPGVKAIYPVGHDRVCYDSAQPEQINGRVIEIRNLFYKKKKPIAAAFHEGVVRMDEQGLHQEALARSLHLALGRAGLWRATLSKTRGEFEYAVDDLMQIYDMTLHPAYRIGTLNKAHGQPGLLYHFRQAARTHKSLDDDAVDRLINGIGRAIIPDKRKTKWVYEGGASLARSISFKSPKLLPKDKEIKAIHPERKIVDTYLSELRFRRSQALVFRQQPEQSRVSQFMHFAYFFPESGQILESEEALLDEIHKSYVSEGYPVEVPPKYSDQLSVAYAGVRAYLTARSDRNITASQILEALTTVSDRTAKPLILAGNLVDLNMRHHAGSKIRASSRMLGFGDAVIPEAFRAMRNAANKDRNDPQETPVAKKLAEVLQLYLSTAFIPYDTGK